MTYILHELRFPRQGAKYQVFTLMWEGLRTEPIVSVRIANGVAPAPVLVALARPDGARQVCVDSTQVDKWHHDITRAEAATRLKKWRKDCDRHHYTEVRTYEHETDAVRHDAAGRVEVPVALPPGDRAVRPRTGSPSRGRHPGGAGVGRKRGPGRAR